MAVDLIPMSNSSDLLSSFWTQGFPVLLDKAAPLFGVLKAAGIVFILYIIFLMVKSFLAMRDHRRLKRVETKLDALIELLGPKEKYSKKGDKLSKKSTPKGLPLKNKRGKKEKKKK